MEYGGWNAWWRWCGKLSTPFALNHLQRNIISDVQNYDASNMGPGDDIDYDTVIDELMKKELKMITMNHLQK